MMDNLSIVLVHVFAGWCFTLPTFRMDGRQELEALSTAASSGMGIRKYRLDENDKSFWVSPFFKKAMFPEAF
ncbi:hypothetical protein [Novacetimonas cocois]|uniref:hypothetical protein n=1 Tax=Novacetimonas cocois TaxID=1747507 RepID=UPI001402A641|nr:hypothetical protein [Novacetimonas cocois]